MIRVTLTKFESNQGGIETKYKIHRLYGLLPGLNRIKVGLKPKSVAITAGNKTSLNRIKVGLKPTGEALAGQLAGLNRIKVGLKRFYDTSDTYSDGEFESNQGGIETVIPDCVSFVIASLNRIKVGLKRNRIAQPQALQV